MNNRSVVFRHFGGPEVLQIADRPILAPAADEVVVRVAGAAVNPTDLMMRGGQQARLMTALEPPFVAGMEFSGRIHARGEGVALDIGQPVIGVVNPRRPQGGAHAEYVVVPAASVATVGEGVDLVDAGTIPMNALTAILALELAGVGAGDTVVITGGTGMVGGFALQLAKKRGIRTIANGNDEALLRGFGADEVIPRDLGQGGVKADALIDAALLGAPAAALVRDGGAAISLRMSHPIEDPRLRASYVSVIDGMERTEHLEEIAGMLNDGSLRPRVAERFAFTDAAAAHRKAEERGRGRVVLTF